MKVPKNLISCGRKAFGRVLEVVAE